MSARLSLELDRVCVARVLDATGELSCEPAHGNQPCKLIVRDGSLALCQATDGAPLATFQCDQLRALELTATSVALRCTRDPNNANLLVKCERPADATTLVQLVNDTTLSDADRKKSAFDSRTEESSASQYFQFYGYLSQQQNMMQDYIRTSTYQRAMLSNMVDFADKVVLDVGAGSGILSFFAVQAGARKVYAVEASNMAAYCQKLTRTNGVADKIEVVAGKIEDIILPEKVDTIISEPMGYMLLNERMLETYLHAKKFLKPGGVMFPSRGDLHVAPFSDEALFIEQSNKSTFWCQTGFHGVDLSSLRPHAIDEYMKQPVVDTWHPAILMAPSIKWSVDFRTAGESDLYDIRIPLQFTMATTAFVHGLAFWFDVAFIGSSETVWLSTSPTEPLTHWYQVRCLVDKPLLCHAGSTLTGHVHLVANTRQSYDVYVSLTMNGVEARASLDLKNPCFRYTGAPVQPPAGHNVGEQSPSDVAQQQQQQAAAAAAAAAAAHSAHPVAQHYWPATAMATVSATSAITMSNGSMTDGAEPKAARMAHTPMAYQPAAVPANPASIYAAFGNVPMPMMGSSAAVQHTHMLGAPVSSTGNTNVAFAAPSTIAS